MMERSRIRFEEKQNTPVDIADQLIAREIPSDPLYKRRANPAQVFRRRPSPFFVSASAIQLHGRCSSEQPADVHNLAGRCFLDAIVILVIYIVESNQK
ncbi:hypothetical protein GUJ93_ZPchr0009g583 [Zizania palustris]|uniref:Uncharacterized protein n=1 Tax=Zizania palustris TaxID=103762 RepID=A0A8J5S4Q1_ZIZPA|nr:hypothetical protein GUJ93_ZPchr0009g583 [Zizania palustris]